MRCDRIYCFSCIQHERKNAPKHHPLPTHTLHRFSYLYKWIHETILTHFIPFSTKNNSDSNINSIEEWPTKQKNQNEQKTHTRRIRYTFCTWTCFTYFYIRFYCLHFNLFGIKTHWFWNRDKNAWFIILA